MKLVKSSKKPHRWAVAQGGDTWLVDDDVPGAPLGKSAVPQRFDLPPGHPLYGQRVLPYVTAGQRSVIMGEDGKLKRDGDDDQGEDDG
jgi:hypothetical protein